MAALAELARILAVLASAGLGARGQVARTIEDRGGLYNMVFGYAMTTPDDYDSVITSSGCVCRSRCLALAGCRSVSLVPLDGDAGGRVECRTSDKPARLLELKERPRLAKTPGAVHFLETFDVSEQGWKVNEINLGPTTSSFTRLLGHIGQRPGSPCRITCLRQFNACVRTGSVETALQ
ncbi:hypothetical protein C7M84_014300 [Penaeus vannamei]|uniref:Uncharacterized protein n=1 Tax=Penaeus vannamei TaxID=6689 RepID=A0A3R7LZN4_PENVA|nr:hypothetical protein C7M84_014300 [Penaeus vannamei]